jgi:hypothetical protein
MIFIKKDIIFVKLLLILTFILTLFLCYPDDYKQEKKMKNKLFLLISILALLALFGTAALCNQCGIITAANITSSVATENNTSETTSTATSANDTVAETTSESETVAETASESSGGISLIDFSKLAPVFAIANEPGEKLISYHIDAGVTKFEELNGAIGEDGQFYTIEYVSKQSANDQDSGRVVSANFDNMEGYVYKTVEKNLTANNSYYLCNSGLINKENLLSTVTAGIAVLDEETKTQIKDIKGRGVQDGWIIDEYSDGTQVLIIVFKPDGNNLLMSIVLKTADGIKFMDYPVVSDGQSAWRVDDGGKIDPKLFSILFTAPTNEGLLTVINWAGAEGENTMALLQSADELSQLPWEVYRYWSAG